ncbi:hypothetical protein [Kangiella taiwanensis]|uniref:Uncharacterized protein n=1 Tax=Kangiella taiwanensis TaxID=1079179 RepID=A0ABP8HYE1_9GAMM|nr:hypothetical protein [Kangiella taiwanensis]
MNRLEVESWLWSTLNDYPYKRDQEDFLNFLDRQSKKIVKQDRQTLLCIVNDWLESGDKTKFSYALAMIQSNNLVETIESVKLQVVRYKEEGIITEVEYHYYANYVLNLEKH